MRREPIRAVEGRAVRVPRDVYDSLAVEGERVAANLGLRIGGVTRLAGALRFDNMIGTIATPLGLIEITPKTRPGQDWMRSVVDLLDDRPVTIADDVPASSLGGPATFRQLLATIFAQRLTRAFAIEGPITTIEIEQHRSRLLDGSLRVEEWIQTLFSEPHVFPVERQTLSRDNPFTRTLSHVAQMLMADVTDTVLRRRLLDTVDQLSHGRDVPEAPPNATDIHLPDQWGAYLPAWTIAQMILRRRTTPDARARPHGVSFAIEPWILLERLLERAVRRLAVTMTSDCATFTSHAQAGRAFLSRAVHNRRSRMLLPDCTLARDGLTIVNFEAKYRDHSITNAPERSESYQAITAGRALGTRLAVLVYPNANEAEVFDVLEKGHRPERLATIGLDLFGYRRGQEGGLAESLRALMEKASVTCMLDKEELAG